MIHDRQANWWRGRDSNPRSCAQLIYSQPPLAAWVPLHASRVQVYKRDMHSNLALIAVLMAVLGLVVGAVIAYIGPLLARTRVPEAPVAPPGVLLPIAG